VYYCVHLQLLEVAGAAPASEVDVEQAPFSFSAKGYVTNANYSTKRPVFVLFINNRLVDSTRYYASIIIHTLPRVRARLCRSVIHTVY
jgi:hypothetical protein